MKTTNLETLKIHTLTQEQYERELAAGRIDENALYLTPNEDKDLSDYETKDDAAKKLQEAKDYTDEKIKDLPVGDSSNAAELIAEHNSDENAHADIRNAIPTKTSDLTNDSNFITSSDVDTKISALVDSAPETLDTLNELAAALGDDPNFATTIATQIGNKVDKSGDTMTGNLVIENTKPAIGFKDTSDGSGVAYGSTDKCARILVQDIYANTTSGRMLQLYSPTATNHTDVATALMLGDVVNSNTTWHTVLHTGNIDKTVRRLDNRGTVIPDNSDLTNYTTPGNFYVPASTNAATIANTPMTGAGYRLIVSQEYGGAALISQTAIGNIFATQFYRCGQYNSTTQVWTWQPWEEVAVVSKTVKKTGDTMTGNLNVNAASASITLKDTTKDKVGKILEADNTLILQSWNSSDLTNAKERRQINLRNQAAYSNVSDALVLYDIDAAGTATSYKIYGEHNKPTTLAYNRTIDGVSFNGGANVTHYGTCSTAAATAAKTVACSYFTLATGSRIIVKFTVTNTAANPTLNVNSTGAKAIYYRGAAIAAGNLAANRVYEFVYDGTNYEMIGNLDTDTKVTQAAATTDNKNLPVLLAYTNSTDATTNTVNKTSTVLVNPSTGTLKATTFSGAAPSGQTDYTTARIRNIQASTADLTAGTSTLASGDIYLVYE